MNYEKRRKSFKDDFMNFDVDNLKIIKPATTIAELPKKAIIYCRVSGDRQVKEGSGLEGQEDSCRRWCHTEGIEVVKVFDDKAISGALIDRPGIESAMQFLEKQNSRYPKIGYFVCTENSRIARPDVVEEVLAVEKRIEATGVKIVTTMEHRDTSTDEGKLLNKIQYAIASYERTKTAKRTKNGRIGKMLQGQRTFKPPTGYIRTGVGKNSIIVQDDKYAPILKEGFELFAQGILQSKADLHRYFVDKRLETNEDDFKGKLWRTFVDKCFHLHRLYFYAGYIFYPGRGVEEPVEAKHPGIIDLHTVAQIIKKIQGTHVPRRKREYDEDFPLKGFISCPSCHRSMTGRFSKSGTGNLYPYYGCSYKDCKKRANIPKQELEEGFRKYLEKNTLPPQVLKLFEVVMKETWDTMAKEDISQRGNKIRRIQGLDDELSALEVVMKKTANDMLYKKLEQQRADKNIEKEILQDEIDNNMYNEDEFRSLYEKTKGVIENPLSFRDIGTSEIKSLLIAVRFGGTLYYSKQKGYRTPETGVLKTILDELKDKDTGNWVWWDSNPRPVA